jgi:hypothetical protein
MAKKKISAEERAVREALAAVQADTGVEQVYKALGVDTSSATYQNFAGAAVRLEEISARPGSTTKQIQTALNEYETAYKAQMSSPSFIPTGQSSFNNSATSNPVVTNTGGGNPGGGNPSPTPAIPLTPSLATTTTVVKPPVKTAPIDTVLIDTDEISADTMIDLIFEDIGGHELINIARNDTVNGQTISYKPIKNLSSIQQQYNPNNILSLQNTSDKYFTNFPIKLETKLLEEGDGSGPNGSYVYIETATGDLIIELASLDTDEQLEVEISLSGTIYEAEFNES